MKFAADFWLKSVDSCIAVKKTHTGDTKSLDVSRQKHRYNAKKNQKKSGVMCDVVCVMCCASRVICHVLYVACHMSLTPTAREMDQPPC